MKSIKILIVLLLFFLHLAYSQAIEGMNGMGGEPAGSEPMPETGKEWAQQSMAFADILGMLDAFKEPAGDMKDAAMPEDGYAAEEDSFWVSDFMDEMGSEKALKMESMNRLLIFFRDIHH